MPIITCPCGNTKVITPYAAEVQGQRYCSRVCAQRFRIYATKAETLSAKVTVTLTKAHRETLEHRAEVEGMLVTELGRRFIIEGLER